LGTSKGEDGAGFITMHRYALPPMGFLSLSASFKEAVKKLRNLQPTCLTLGLHPTRLPSARSDTYLIRSQRCAGALLPTSPGASSDARFAVLAQAIL
jgi:hypothetical protein